MKTSEKNLTVRYSLIQGFFWMVFGDITGFASVYLLDCGFSNTQIGMLIAVAGIASALLQPVLAGYADKPKSPSLKTIIAILMGIQVMLGILLSLLYQKVFLLTGLFYGCSIAILQLLTPFVNSLGMESINQGKKLNFGVARGTGSVGYALVAYSLGAIIARTGAVFIPISIAVLWTAVLAGMLLFPFQKVPRQETEETSKSSDNPLTFFRRYKRFGIVLLGCLSVYISHALLNSYTFQIVESKGGGSEEMGVAMAIAAFVEMPTLFLFTFMLKKVRCDIWFRISGIFFMLKAVGSLLAPNISVFYAVQLFQMFGWGLLVVASVYFVNSIMDERDAIKGQAYMTMMHTLGNAIGALMGGALIDLSGANSMLLFSAACATVGMMIMLFATERTKDHP